MPLLRPTLTFALCLLFVPIGAAAFECQSSTGIDMTVYGEKGDLDLFIPPEMISAFLECLEPSM